MSALAGREIYPEAQSLQESLGVGAADISWILVGFSPPYFVPGYKKGLFFYKSRTCGGLKKDPLFREICNAGAAPLCT